MSFIEAENLVVSYNRRAVLDSLTTVLNGRSVGLLGPNGAGKSTFIKTILGFLTPDSGRIHVMGHDVVRNPTQVRRLIGYMPEHEAYIQDMSAVRLLRYLGELSGLPGRTAMERAHEVLYYVGLGELRYRPVNTYSLGNQQRVKLAQALLHGPRLLILDEPTNSLDPDGRQDMLELVRDIGSISGSHVLMCSHILHDVEFCCESVAVMHRGKVVLNGNIAELKKDDLRTYEVRVGGDRERFLGAIAARGWTCNEDDRGNIRLELPEGESTRSLFAVARELGVQLRHFHFKRDSLEEIFVNALVDAERQARRAGA